MKSSFNKYEVIQKIPHDGMTLNSFSGTGLRTWNVNNL